MARLSHNRQPSLAAMPSAASCVARVIGSGGGQRARMLARACATSGHGLRSLRRATLANSSRT